MDDDRPLPDCIVNFPADDGKNAKLQQPRDFKLSEYC